MSIVSGIAGTTDRHRDHCIDPVAVPASIAPAVEGYAWARDAVGESGGAVYRLHAEDKPTLYLKYGTGQVATAVTDEMARLLWLGRSIAVPEVRRFVASPGDAWLLMTAIPGKTAYQCLDEHPERAARTVEAIAGFLRTIHALPVDTCPFDSGHALRLAHARRRLEAGEVDTDDFGEDHRGWSPEQVWREMTALLPIEFEPVVTHGDFSLDNILLEDGRVTGCIDVGLAGVADRYQDLAILADCLDEFDPTFRRELWRAYGIDDPESHKLAFHHCLDEFF